MRASHVMSWDQIGVKSSACGNRYLAQPYITAKAVADTCLSNKTFITMVQAALEETEEEMAKEKEKAKEKANEKEKAKEMEKAKEKAGVKAKPVNRSSILLPTIPIKYDFFS